MRRPNAYFPGLRPLVSTSNSTGRMTVSETTSRIDAACATASDMPPTSMPTPKKPSERVFNLYVKVANRWILECELSAPTQPEAMRKAIGCLKPEHYDKAIRLEPVEKIPPPTRAAPQSGPAASAPSADTGNISPGAF